MAYLDPYSGTWDARRAAHLLRRTTFVTSSIESKRLASMSLSEAVDKILTTKTSLPDPPVDPATNATWVNNPTPVAQDFMYRPYVKLWWLKLMMTPDDVNITEKLTLCWHNHFATESDTVGESRFMYHYNQTLRRNALGNFKNFVREITIDPAMLRYLNGEQNTASKPNENYARELQELFTIGKGRERAPFDYTTYSESDVRVAARVLTGWRTQRNGDPSKSVFLQNQHDTGDKTFSANYQGTTIKGRNSATAGLDELNDMLDMIFRQQATAVYIVTKLYRWFVHYEVTNEVKTNVIEPLAVDFAKNFEIKPILRRLLMSEHFFNESFIGSMIKSPIDLVVGLMNKFQPRVPTAVADQYAFYNYFVVAGAALQQNLLDPPSVAGWTAYHQEPDYYRQWINSATLPNRYAFTDLSLYGGSRFPAGAIINTLAYTDSVSRNPDDPTALVNDIANDLFVAVPLSTEQKTFLRDTVLLNGGKITATQWKQLWTAYTANPSSATAQKPVADSIKNLMRYMFRLSEFQLM
jgi:uncharacterized protein (DUF1800 family)